MYNKINTLGIKKILISIFLVLVLSSCFWEKKEDIKEIKIKKIINEKIEKLDLKVKSIEKKDPVLKKVIFNKETNDFIKKLEIEPDSLNATKCEILKNKETIKYCIDEKEKYLNFLEINEKNNAEIAKEIQNYRNKNIMKIVDEEYRWLLLRLEKDSSFLKEIECENFSSIKSKDFCKKEKESYLKFINKIK